MHQGAAPNALLRFSIGLREAAGASPAIAVVRFEPLSVQYLVMTSSIWSPRL
jgi:hypothetical protein